MDWTALVIDDDSGIRQSLRLCLEVSGARVLGVATAEAALAALDRGQFDVVFLDLWLGVRLRARSVAGDHTTATGGGRRRRDRLCLD